MSIKDDFENDSWKMHVKWAHRDLDRLRMWWPKRHQAGVRRLIRGMIVQAKISRDKCKRMYPTFKL